MRRFLLAAVAAVALGLGSMGAAHATDTFYPYWPYWALDTTNNFQAYNGTLFQFGTGLSVPAHISSAQTTAPALTSCGTGPTDVGATDASGTVTMGTSATGCVITFNAAYTTAPHCTVTWRATPLASQSYTISATALTLTQTSTSSNLVDYFCAAPAGG